MIDIEGTLLTFSHLTGVKNLPGKWRVEIGHSHYGFSYHDNCTDLMVYENGWCAFKDHTGKVHIATGNVHLISQEA